ncbi:pilus assembly FimT family protein [Niveibacterium terrae]|uniref:pilus assembly FimT family protein n=1 Tax=Niveibacterium terrae TaxID=3373598 RepID=UPI003A941417
MLVTLAVLAILITIAVPNFVSTTQQTRSQVASEGLLRAAASARQIALQTGKPTKIVVNKKVDDCGNPVAWAVTQQDPTTKTDKSLSCLSSTDFAKRYKNTALSLEGDASEVEIEFAPTGIGNNLNTEPVVSLASGSKTVRIRFNAGGTTQIL